MAFSCDSTLDSLDRSNTRPEITFTFLENDITKHRDSIKISTAIFDRGYSQDVTVIDPNNNLAEVYFLIRSGAGSVTSAGVLSSRRLRVKSDFNENIYQFTFTPSATGFHEIQIFARDHFNRYDTLSLQLAAFDNLVPVSRFSVSPRRVITEFEHNIDASASFDQDSDYGGFIKNYEFTINGQVITRETPILPFPFGQEQIVTISVRVQDNDNIWSERTEEIVSIN